MQDQQRATSRGKKMGRNGLLSDMIYEQNKQLKILIPNQRMADLKKTNLPSVENKDRKVIDFILSQQILTPREKPRGFSETPKNFDKFSQSVLPNLSQNGSPIQHDRDIHKVLKNSQSSEINGNNQAGDEPMYKLKASQI